jgi:hypothetical protein
MLNPPRATLHDLPDELLLHIGAQFTHLRRNHDLSALSLVSRKWRTIAQEWLLKAPRFNLTYIDLYLWELAHKPHLIPQIHTLEIWGTSAGRVTRDEHGLSVKKYTPTPAPPLLLRRQLFLEKCVEVIEHYGDTPRHKHKWRDALQDDVVPALFGVLMCILPNLTSLKLGNAWLMDFPIFSQILSADVRADYYSPNGWRHRYLAGPLGVVAGKLEVLEIPADMTALYFCSRAATVFDYRQFTNLKELGVSMRALGGYATRPHAPPEPKEILPRGLEVLRISEATQYTANFINALCLAKNTGYFTKLKRVDIYHAIHHNMTDELASILMCLTPVEDVHRVCASAGVALYLYFPGWRMHTWEIGATPWSLREEGRGVLRNAERSVYNLPMADVAFPAFQLEWDVDGDAIME